MIISCEKCNKKFEISNNLIPEEGRILQCGSCSHKWHFKPIIEQKSSEKIQTKENDEEDLIKETSKKNDEKESINKKDNYNKISVNEHKKKVGFLSYLLVIIISFIALIIVGETFEPLISNYIPSFDFYLMSLKESLKDIFLFFKNLIND